MKRETLCLVGGLVLSAAVIGWLGGENRSLRKQLIGQVDAGGESTTHATAPGGKQVGSSKGAEKSDPYQRETSPSASGRFRDHRQRSTKREGTPGNMSVVRIQDADGSSYRTEGDLTVNEIQTQPTMTTVVQAESASESLLKNSGFDQELAPWVCENGKIVPDPDDPENTVLEVRLGDPGFRVSQSFQTAGKGDLTLSFRSTSKEPMEDRPTWLALKLFGNGGKTIVYSSMVSTKKTSPSGVTSIKLPAEVSSSSLRPDLLMIESWNGKGTLLLDDVKLEQEIKP